MRLTLTFSNYFLPIVDISASDATFPFSFYRADLLMTVGRVSQLALRVLSRCISRHIGLWRNNETAKVSLFCEDFCSH